MKIIFPMAGMGSRFKKEGYKQEKYEIKVKDKTLFEYSVESLIAFNQIDNEFIFIGRKETNFEKFVQDKCKEMNIQQFSVIALDKTTSGQAETVYEYTKNIKDENILIFNIDSYIKPNVITPKDIKTNLWWLVADMTGEKWSFIKLNDNDFETSEKKRISDNASLGMYYFQDSNDFNRIYETKASEIIKKWNEVYIAPMYNYLNKKMSIKKINDNQFHTLGTPEEVKKFESLLK